MSFTPCALRPVSRISSTRVRSVWPRSVMSITSSPSFTSLMPTTGPFRSLASMRMMPLPPRFCVAELVDVRALAVAVRAHREHVRPRRRRSPRGRRPRRPRRGRCPSRPCVARPIGRTCSSGKRMLWPILVAMRSSRVAVGERGVEELVALVDLHADDALLAEVLVLVELGLLDLPVLRERDDELALLDLRAPRRWPRSSRPAPCR